MVLKEFCVLWLVLVWLKCMFDNLCLMRLVMLLLIGVVLWFLVSVV